MASEAGPESVMWPWPPSASLNSQAGVFPLTSLDHKFFDFCVVVYPAHAPEHGSQRLQEAPVREWKEWRRPAPKK